MEFNIEQVKENIRVVDSNRNYWFVRSYGGELYYDYLERNYVGVGFNNIPSQLIQEASKGDTATFDRLKLSITNQYNIGGGDATKWANQLIDFYKAIKIDDMIIMPSKNSNKYAFGIVTSEPYLVSNKNRTFVFRKGFEPYPERRRGIKWLKEIHRSNLNGDLKALSSSHAAITNANNYKEAIEGNLSSLFILEDKIYLTLKINQHEDINAFDFQNFLSGLTFFYKEFCIENGYEANEELFLKIQVQSPGKVALKALVYAGVVGITGLFALSGHPDLKLNLLGLVHLESKGDGFFPSLTKFLDANQERKIRYEKFQDSLHRLKVDTIHHPVDVKEETVIQHKTAIKKGKKIVINNFNINEVNNTATKESPDEDSTKLD